MSRSITRSPQTEILRTREELSALRRDWERLWSSSVRPSPFLSWEWVTTWLETLGRRHTPLVVTVRSPPSGELLGLGPFALRGYPHVRWGPYQVARFLGAPGLAPDHLDLPALPGQSHAVADAVAGVLNQEPIRELHLNGMCGDAPLLTHMRAGRSSICSYAAMSPCPYVTLPGSWAIYLQSLSTNRRHQVRKKLRRFEDLEPGRSRFTTATTAEECSDTLEDLFRLHQDVREAHGQPGAFRLAECRAFHHTLAQQFLERGWLRLHSLELDGWRIAVLYGFQVRGVVSFYQTGYDRGHARLSGGAAIMAYAIRQAIGEGAHEFDLLRGTEPYKSRWSTGTRNDVKLRVAMRSSGVCGVQLFRLARSLRHRIAPPP